MRNLRHSVSLGTFGLAFAVVLSPAFMESSGSLTCVETGDPSLMTLEVEVAGQNHIVGFDPDRQSYDVWLPLAADTAIVRAYSTEPDTNVMYNFRDDSGLIEGGPFPIGGGEITLDGVLPEGVSDLLVSGQAPGRATRSYLIGVHVGCSECDGPLDCKTGRCDDTFQLCSGPMVDGATCDFGGGPGECLAGDCIEDPWSWPPIGR